MLFQYRALKDNKIITSKIEAENEQAVLQYLKKNAIFPLEIKKPQSKMNLPWLASLFNQVSFNEVVGFTRQLSIMLNAGLTLTDSFEILKKQTTSLALLKLIEDLDKEIREGNSFSSALKKYPQYFPNLYIALIKSGEISGKMSDILLKLADNLEKKREFQGKMKGAMIYPMVIILAMLGVMFVMITFVMPKLLNLYKDFDVKLPMPTLVLMAVSSFSSQYWPFILAVIIGFITGIRKIFNSAKGKLVMDNLTLKIPVVKNVVKMAALVDSTRTIAILAASGISILESLEIVVETTANAVYQGAFRSMLKQVERGVSLGDAMTNEQIFPPILVQMTLVGEQTGHIDETMLRISKYFETESSAAVKAMTTLIEPATLVVLGISVGFLVMAIITPIFNLTSSFQ